jgi:1-deoxy-D-xylulose-5-phosphate synthase
VTPEEVKSMPAAQLPDLAENVRRSIIDSVSANGGHLAASLGTVELAIALLRTFDPPEDKVLWDVGHQAYAWKILTGRGGDFGTLRKHRGISGFPNPSESQYDAFVAGHAGSALAAATGMAAARDRLGGGHVVAVIGDASLTNGESLEALNNCATLAGRLIVIVNDNAMAISKNVGGIARMLGKLLSNVRYNRVKAAAERMGHRMRLTFLRTAYHRAEQVMKSLWLKNSLFETLGLRYIGPVDGHDLKAVMSALTVAKNDKRPVLLHVVTTKGKGFAPAERDPSAWHGVGPFDVAAALAGASAPSAQAASWSDVFGDAMVEAARRDEKICAVVAAMKDGTGLAKFASEFPGRFFDVGICEEMAVTFAAGLAKSGMKPVVAVYSTFLQRAIGQIQHDVCLQKLPVVFAVDRAGCVGADGFTHHGMYDMALLKPLSGLSILAPTSAEGLKEALASAFASGGPVAIRYPRGAAPARADIEPEAGRIGGGKVEVRLLAVGDQAVKALKVRSLLAAEGVVAEVVPVSQVKPAAVPERDGALTVSIENGTVCGGYGESAGADAKFGWPDAPVAHGSVDELEREHGFDAEAVAGAILGLVAQRRRKGGE